MSKYNTYKRSKEKFESIVKDQEALVAAFLLKFNEGKHAEAMSRYAESVEVYSIAAKLAKEILDQMNGARGQEYTFPAYSEEIVEWLVGNITQQIERQNKRTENLAYKIIYDCFTRF